MVLQNAACGHQRMVESGLTAMRHGSRSNLGSADTRSHHGNSRVISVAGSRSYLISSRAIVRPAPNTLKLLLYKSRTRRPSSTVPSKKGHRCFHCRRAARSQSRSVLNSDHDHASMMFVLPMSRVTAAATRSSIQKFVARVRLRVANGNRAPNICATLDRLMAYTRSSAPSRGRSPIRSSGRATDTC